MKNALHHFLSSCLFVTLLLAGAHSAHAQTLTLSSPTATTYTSRDVPFVATATGFSPFKVEFYEGTPDDAFVDTYLGQGTHEGNGRYTLTRPFADGTYTVYALATGLTGSLHSNLVTFTVYTGPSLVLLEPAQGSMKTRTVLFRARATNFAPPKVEIYNGNPDDAFTDVWLGSAPHIGDGIYQAEFSFETPGEKLVYAYAFVGNFNARSPLVTFMVVDPPVIGVDDTTVQPGPIDLSGVTETPAVPITISNPGSGTLNWNLNSTVSWLYWNQGSGSLPSGQSITLNLWVDVALLGQLGPGTYTGTVYVAAPGAQVPQVPIHVTLTVNETAPANPVVLPPSQRYLLNVSGGRIDYGSGDVQLSLFVEGIRVNPAQPGATAQVQITGPNGPITSPVFTSPYLFDDRRTLFLTNDPDVPPAPGTYTLNFVFEDETVTRQFTIPETGESLPAPQPVVVAPSDGSLTVQWSAVPRARSYFVDVYEVQVGGALGRVGGSSYLRTLNWGLPAGTLQPGSSYVVLVTASDLDPRHLPLSTSFNAVAGWSSEFSVNAAVPPGLTGADPQVDVCGRTVTITWTTDQPASTWVHYGTTESYGVWKRIYNETGTVHQMVLENLEPGRTYHFQAYSATPQGLEWRSKDLSATIHPNALHLRGDVNRSGTVDVTDAILLLQYIVDLPVNFDEEQERLANVNGIGGIDVADAILVLRIIVDLERDCWPALESLD